MNHLKLLLHKGHLLLRSARATHHSLTDDIILYLPNIMKDIDFDLEGTYIDVECFANTLDRLILTEIICSFVYKLCGTNRRLCEGKMECPITKILRRLDLNYTLKLPCDVGKDKYKYKKNVKFHNNNAKLAKNKRKKIEFSMGDGIPLLIPQPPPIGGKMETTSPS
jgi:hypothetical protein